MITQLATASSIVGHMCQTASHAKALTQNIHTSHCSLIYIFFYFYSLSYHRT